LKHLLAFLCLGGLAISCAPKVSTTVSQTLPASDYKGEVIVIGLEEAFPEDAKELGTVKIGDTGFTTNCGWEVVIAEAKLEARKAGGNALKIVSHKPPTTLGSSCHRIVATILLVADPSSFQSDEETDSTLLNADYALLHVYRHSGIGPLVSYDLRLGDTVICRVANKFKKTIKIRRYGHHTLWAKTEAKEELPMNIQPGHEYYIRCAVTMGAFVGHPSLALVDAGTGRAEFNAVKVAKSNKRDVISLKDGRDVECIVNREDQDNIYCTMIRGGKRVDTHIAKSDIKSIQRSE